MILTTGGAGRIFQSTTNAHINTGDGLGMVMCWLSVARYGILAIHPTGIYGSSSLISESVW